MIRIPEYEGQKIQIDSASLDKLIEQMEDPEDYDEEEVMEEFLSSNKIGIFPDRWY